MQPYTLHTYVEYSFVTDGGVSQCEYIRCRLWYVDKLCTDPLRDQFANICARAHYITKIICVCMKHAYNFTHARRNPH